MSNNSSIVGQNEARTIAISKNRNKKSNASKWDSHVGISHPIEDAMIALGRYFRGDYVWAADIAEIIKIVNKAGPRFCSHIRKSLEFMEDPCAEYLSERLIVKSGNGRCKS